MISDVAKQTKNVAESKKQLSCMISWKSVRSVLNSTMMPLDIKKKISFEMNSVKNNCATNMLKADKNNNSIKND